MKALPKTTAGAVRLSLLVAVFVAILFSSHFNRVIADCFSEKHEGDIVLQSLPHGPLVDAIEGVTRSEWSHCGILTKRDGNWQVAEAIGSVRYTPLYRWIIRGRAYRIEAYRPKVLHPGDEAKIEAGIQKLFGRRYDYRYAPDDQAIYCSELVYKVYDRELGIKMGQWEKLGDLAWKGHEQYVRDMEGGGLPLDREMITPVGLTRSSTLVRVFPKND